MNATVKRKFNALIHGISSRPSTAVSGQDSISDLNGNDGPHDDANLETDSSSIMANDFGFLAKKRRVDPGTSTSSKYASLRNDRTPPPKAPTTISNVTLRKWTPNGTTNTPPPKDTQPKYCPGDRDQLIKRLASFQELTDWTPKPDPVNEVEWAKRGWVCHGKERIRCTLCNKELVVKLNRKDVDGKEVPVLVASEIEDALVQKYVELIVESHAEDCLWRKRGCDGMLLIFSVWNSKLISSRFSSTATASSSKDSNRKPSLTVRRALRTQRFPTIRIQSPPARIP